MTGATTHVVDPVKSETARLLACLDSPRLSPRTAIRFRVWVKRLDKDTRHRLTANEQDALRSAERFLGCGPVDRTATNTRRLAARARRALGHSGPLDDKPAAPLPSWLYEPAAAPPVRPTVAAAYLRALAAVLAWCAASDCY